MVIVSGNRLCATSLPKKKKQGRSQDGIVRAYGRYFTRRQKTGGGEKWEERQMGRGKGFGNKEGVDFDLSSGGGARGEKNRVRVIS